MIKIDLMLIIMCYVGVLSKLTTISHDVSNILYLLVSRRNYYINTHEMQVNEYVSMRYPSRRSLDQ